jgi:pimeloyl-ACP methyl ester carboxylesterase
LSERIVERDGIVLWTESFGDAAMPAVLLLMGSYYQGIAWPDEFCSGIASQGRYVIRYDHRDVGQSSVIDYERNPYTLEDMARDAVRILDGYGIVTAHFVGASMGGMIAQEVALSFPSRVLSLTSFMSTPLAKSFTDGSAAPELPGPTEAAWKAFETVPLAGSTMTREERIEGWTQFQRAVSGTLVPFDEEAQRRLQTRFVERTQDPDAMWHHLTATASSPDRTDRLGSLDVPTLVVHGTLDPVIPVAHAYATAAAIPGAELLIVDGLGHEYDPRALEPVAAAVVRHTSAAEATVGNTASSTN